jgi:tetratricopeptide (TPR) repeat protein
MHNSDPSPYELLQEARALAERNPAAALQRAIELLGNSQAPGLLRVIAQAQRALGGNEAAQAAEMLAVETSFSDPHLQQADALAQQGRSAEAASIAANYLEAFPDDLLGLTLLGEALLARRRLSHAEDIGRHVVERAPRFVRGKILLGQSLMLQSRVTEALALLESHLQPRPEESLRRDFLAKLQVDAGKFDEAAATYEQMLATQTDDAGLWVNYGFTLRFAGRKADAEQAFREAIKHDPENGSAWWSLSGLVEPPFPAEDLAALRKAIDQAPADSVNAGNLHLALATLLDRGGQHEEAFRHFARSNELMRSAIPYDAGQLSREVDESIATSTKDFFIQRTDWGAADNAPIFIIGMPRSGSTLVERILGRHSQIEAAGELQIIPRLVDELDGEAGRVGGYRQLIASLPAERIRKLGEQYVERSVGFRRTDKPRFTDKLHVNWRHLGLIRLILPQAKIIDVRRDPLDCCWSNYRTLFAQGHPASNDLRDIARFYRDYRRLADHFAAMSTGTLLVVQYEEVVEEVEVQTRRMLEFLGLDFEAECLDFHLLADPVATASAEQVRKPLNTEGIGRWKPYQKWLGPMIDELGPSPEVEPA